MLNEWWKTLGDADQISSKIIKGSLQETCIRKEKMKVVTMDCITSFLLWRLEKVRTSEVPRH